MAMTKTLIGITLLTLASASSFNLQAKQKLSIDKAIELALNHDPRIEEKKAFVRKAEALLQQAQGSGGFRYSANSFLAITTGVDGGFYEGGDSSCTGSCTPRDDLYDINDGYSLWAGLTFSIIKPLMTFGRLESYEKAAQNNILIKQQDVSLQRDKIALDVVRAYYGYLTARDSRFLLEDTRKRLTAALDLVEEWLEEGKGAASQTEKYALQSGLGLVDSFLAEAIRVESIAMAGLKLLTGRDEKLIALADKRLKPLPLPKKSLEEWVSLALTNRPEFKQVEAGLAARRALVEVKRAEKRPILFAGVAGSLAYSPGRDKLENPHVYDPFNHVGVSPLIGMRWQWEGAAQTAKVAQAQADLEAVVHKASFARAGIPFQVAEQYHSMQAKYRATQSMKASAKAARRWMIAAYTDFEAGLEKADKILTAMQVYVLAYAEYLKAVNAYNNHISKLKSVSGVFQ